ncbi:MAG: type II toxin-antitoxin system RelE/ParE family toxin [Acidobacteriota bacterium]
MPLALSQVQEIVEFIQRDKPKAAAKRADGVFDRVEALAVSPQQGRVVPEAGRSEVRELLHGRYRIIYRLDQKSISILTVRHGSRLIDVSEFDS